MNGFHRNIIHSICKQCELIAADGPTHMPETAKIYNRLIDVQILALGDEINTLEAINLLKQAKALTEK